LVFGVLFLLPPASAQETTRNIVVGGSIIASVGDDTEFFHQDRLGSIRFATDFSGRATGESKTLPFGEAIEEGLRYTFTGKEKDTSGLFHMGARYYQPDLGRFVSADPAGNGNAYAFARNNPLRYTDPDGRAPVPIDEADMQGILGYQNRIRLD